MNGPIAADGRAAEVEIINHCPNAKKRHGLHGIGILLRFCPGDEDVKLRWTVKLAKKRGKVTGLHHMSHGDEVGDGYGAGGDQLDKELEGRGGLDDGVCELHPAFQVASIRRDEVAEHAAGGTVSRGRGKGRGEGAGITRAPEAYLAESR